MGKWFSISLVFATQLAVAAPNMQEGEWETSLRMTMPGIPPQNITQKACYTKADVAQITQKLTQGNSRNQSGMNCKMLDQKSSGDTITFSMQCDGAMKVQSRGSMTFKGDSYQADITTDMQGGPQGPITMHQVIQSRRLGACKP